MSWKYVFRSLGVLLLFAGSSFAQDLKSEVNVEGIAALTHSTNNLVLPYSASTSGGFLAGYRYHFTPLLAVEGDYAFTRNTQKFLNPLNLGTGVQTNVQEWTGALVLTANGRRRVRPYALAGGGALFFHPTNSAINALIGIGNNLGVSFNQTRPAFLYGGGVDFDLTRYMALRAEYRGLVFKAPGFDIPGLPFLGMNSSNFTHMAQPAVGLVWRF